MALVAGVSPTPLNEWECVSYTLLQQRHPELFDPACMQTVLGQLGNGGGATPQQTYGQAQALIEIDAAVAPIANDIDRLEKAGGSVAHLGDKNKLQRFIDVNRYVLDVGARMRSPAQHETVTAAGK